MIKTPSDSRDHRGWLEYWGEQAVAAIADAVAHPEFVYEDFKMQYAVHCARIAHSRAIKVRRSLKGASTIQIR